MILEEERTKLATYCRKLKNDRLTPGTSGNLSILNKEEGLIAITPSGMDYLTLTPGDIVVIDMDKNIIDSNRIPSSEIGLHIAFYKEKVDARAVVHTHSMYCTTMASMGESIKAVHYVIGDAGTSEIKVAPYQLYGTVELADAAIEWCGEGRAVLLANHGMVAYGSSIQDAYSLACNLEYLAELQYHTMCAGKSNILSNDQMERVLEKFKTYGQR